jgi:hypothetical protein
VNSSVICAFFYSRWQIRALVALLPLNTKDGRRLTCGPTTLLKILDHGPNCFRSGAAWHGFAYLAQQAWPFRGRQSRSGLKG